MAITNSRPALTSASTTPGSNGTTAQAASAGMIVITGATKNRPLLAAVGRMISLKISLTASAIGVQQAERADAVRARTDLRSSAMALRSHSVR